MDALTTIETKVRDALRSIAGVEGVYGEADIPFTKTTALPGYLVVCPGNENPTHQDSEGFCGDTVVDRDVQLDIGCIADETRLTFTPIVRELRAAAISRLSDLESLDLPGVYRLRYLGVQRTQFPSEEGTLGGLFITYRVSFASRLADFSTILPAN